MNTETIDDLLAIMARLRDPENGCPWDLQQTFPSIASYTIEEAYEVADAIDREAWSELPGELGDLLFQVVFYSQMAGERGWFEFADVVRNINEKMVRRHPHVFGDKQYASVQEQAAAWEAIKRQEKSSWPAAEGALAGVATGLEPMRRAIKLQKAAARVGFDWDQPEPILDKLDEERDELTEAMASGDREHCREELGDLLFVVCNLARQLDLDPGRALREANLKFERRFTEMERMAAEGGEVLSGQPLERLEALWQQAKRRLRRDETSGG